MVVGFPGCSSLPGAATGSPAAAGTRWRRCAPHSSLLSPRDHLRGGDGIGWGVLGQDRVLTTLTHPGMGPPSPPPLQATTQQLQPCLRTPHCRVGLQPLCPATPSRGSPQPLPRARDAHMMVECCCSPKTSPCPAPSPPSLSVLLSCLGSIHDPHRDLVRVPPVGAAPHPAPARCQPTQHTAGPRGPSFHWHRMGPGTTSSSHLSPPCGGHHQDAPTITLQLRAGLQRGSRSLHPPYMSTHLPSQPGHGRGLSEEGSEALAPSQRSIWGAELPTPLASPSSGAHSPNPTLTAAEPPLPAGAGAPPHRQEPELTAGRASWRSLL